MLLSSFDLGDVHLSYYRENRRHDLAVVSQLMALSTLRQTQTRMVVFRNTTQQTYQ